MWRSGVESRSYVGFVVCRRSGGQLAGEQEAPTTWSLLGRAYREKGGRKGNRAVFHLNISLIPIYTFLYYISLLSSNSPGSQL